jgi:hypothetical protein
MTADLSTTSNMPDFIHLWDVRRGLPDSNDSAIEISNRLVDVEDSGTRLPLGDLIEAVLKRYPIVSVQPATLLPLADEDVPADESRGFRPVDPLWQAAPVTAYEKFRPAALRLRLTDSALHFFPCVYEILEFCKGRGIVAIHADVNSAAYWQPDGFSKRHNSVVVNYGADEWDALTSVLEPPTERGVLRWIGNRRHRPAVNPVWLTVTRGLEEALASHGFEPSTSIRGAHNRQIIAGFFRTVPAGMQSINWRMARFPADKGNHAVLCLRMSIKMTMDILPDTLWGVMKLYNRAVTSAFHAELSEFLTKVEPDSGHLYMANRDEWGASSDKVSVEDPKNLARVLATLKDHAIPWLNRCDTARNTLYALRGSNYLFAKEDVPLIQLVLAWHVQDLHLYEELKQVFVREAAGRYGTDPREAVKLLESSNPAFKD